MGMDDIMSQSTDALSFRVMKKEDGGVEGGSHNDEIRKEFEGGDRNPPGGTGKKDAKRDDTLTRA